MNSKLALMPLLIMSAFSYAADEATPETPVQQQLQEVNVRADAKRVKAARSYSIASDGDLRDRVNLGVLGKANAFTAPITVVNYDEKVLENNASRTLVDTIAKNDASVMQFGGESNTLQGLYVRGLQLDAKQFSINGLPGLYSYWHTPTANVASAQLIKGASSSTVGMDPEGATGSSVNIETKKASDEGNRKIGLGWFSNNRVQGSFDLGQRFGENKELGVRLSGKYRKGDTPRKGYDEDNQEVGLNADYRGEKLRIAYDAMYNHRNTAGGRARFQDMQNYNFAMPAAPNGKINLAPSWHEQTTKTVTNMLTFEYDTDYNMQLSGGIGHMESKYYGGFIQLRMDDPSLKGWQLGNYRAGAASPWNIQSRTTSGTLKARGEFETGPIVHNWAASLDYISRSRNHKSGPGNYGDAFRSNIYAPDFSGITPKFPSAERQSVNITQTTPSIAVSDTLGFVDNTIRLTLGGRYQWVKENNHLTNRKVSKSRFGPMLAASWVPSPDFVVYGNFMEDLEPGEVDEETGLVSKPRVSQQVELGVRKNWGDIVTSANIYQITRPGYWRGNTKSGTDFAAYRKAGLAVSGEEQGKERYRGLELNVYANLLNKTLRPSIGMSFIRSDLIDFPTWSDNLVNGHQVTSPKYIAKAGLEWDTPFVKGLTLNTNVQYYGSSYQNASNTYKLPSYTLVDAGARYRTKVGKGNTLTIGGSVENLFNKKYWQIQRGRFDRSFAVVGMPRTYWLKAELDF